MSKENVVTFYEQHVMKKPEIETKLKAAESRDQFADIAIAEGGKAGLTFSRDDLGAVMEATEKKIGGALSDQQLDGVVGGAGPAAPGHAATPMVRVATLPAMQKPALVPAGLKQGSTIGCCW